MKRVSVVILILIILGFIMTIKRDGPSVITGDPSASISTADNHKKGVKHNASKSKTTNNNKTAVVSSPLKSAKTNISKPVVVAKQVAETALINTAETDSFEGGEDLGRQVHRELTRLRCFSGNIKNRWGRRSRAAVKRFNRISKFSWPDWPSRDLVRSLRNYPDAYCKKCRGGGGKGCEIANAIAPTDETTKSGRVKSDVKSAPSNLLIGAARSEAEEATVKEVAAKQAAENAIPQTGSDVGDKQQQPVPSVVPNDASKNSEEANDAGVGNHADDGTNATSSHPPREVRPAPRVDEPRQRSSKRHARSKRRSVKSSRTRRQRRSVAKRQQRWMREYWEDIEPQRRYYPYHRGWDGDWSPRESGVWR